MIFYFSGNLSLLNTWPLLADIKPDPGCLGYVGRIECAFHRISDSSGAVYRSPREGSWRLRFASGTGRSKRGAKLPMEGAAGAFCVEHMKMEISN